MTGRWDAERDASDAAQALAGIVALLQRAANDEVDRNQLLSLARSAESSAERVAAFLRGQRGANDGDMVAVPPRLGPWRDWTPSRGHLLGAVPARVNGVPQPRRCGDPGE
ncbi:hypothetical protein ACQP2E_34250 [Actinoplanes sp. CA-015351]|uniref:hypothetical protein n=1 Tax=Actinoplanes sp. CA-015351 TaxID=3239897 RepID=UPI003D95F9FF